MKPEGITNSQWLRFNFHFLLEHFLGLKLFEKIAGDSRKVLIREIGKQLENSNRGELLQATVLHTDLKKQTLQEKYLNNIFEIESKMRVKDLRISLLEFEVALQKQLLASFKKHVNFSLEKVKL